MGRLERNIRRKVRRRTVIFSLLIILFFFVLGIGTTNNVMVQMTGISPEDNILSEHNIYVYAEKIKGFRTEIQWVVNAQMIMKEWIDRIREIIGEMSGRI